MSGGDKHQDEALGVVPGVEDDRARVKHRAEHPVPQHRPHFIVERTAGRLYGDDGAQAVRAVPRRHLDGGWGWPRAASPSR